VLLGPAGRLRAQSIEGERGHATDRTGVRPSVPQLGQRSTVYRVWVADDEDVAFNDVQPLALPDEIDEDRLGRLLRKIEARADAGGWDGPLSTLHVYLVYDNTLVATDQTFRHMLADNPSIGPGLRLGGYTAQLMLPAAWTPARRAPSTRRCAGSR
jgi:hypothetical protein